MAEYIQLEFDVDAGSLQDQAHARLAELVDGWEPNDGNPEVVIIEAVSELIADNAARDGTISRAIFRFFGESIFGINPLVGTPATGTSAWTLNEGGHTIPEGAVVLVDGQAFVTTEEVEVPEGAFSAEVAIESVSYTSDANLSNPSQVELADTFFWVDEVSLVGSTTGGSLGETEDEYFVRLSAELGTLSTSPVRAAEFSTLARRIPTVHRALTLDNHDPGTDEISTFSTTGTPSAGSFTTTVDGQTTGAIAWNTTAAAMKTLIAALSNITEDDFTISGGPFPATPIVIHWHGAKGAQNVAVSVTDSITGGDATVTATATGSAPLDDQERMVTITAVDEDGEYVGDTVMEQVRSMLNELREVGFEVHRTRPAYHEIDVDVTVTRYPDYPTSNVEDTVEAVIENYLSPAVFGTTDHSSESWVAHESLHRLSLAAKVRDASGVFQVDSIEINGVEDDFDFTGGSIHLTRPGTINVTVSNP